MNEDDTFKKLKSLTVEEAMQIFHDTYLEAAKSMEADGVDTSAGIPVFLIRHEVEAKLKPYGIDWDTIFSHVFKDFS